MIPRLHRRMFSRPRRPRGDDGMIMVIALVIITVFGLLIGLILSEAQVNFRSTEVTGSIRNMTNAADGGIEQGIGQVQNGNCSTPASSPSQVSGSPVSFNEPGINPSVTVLCQDTGGSAFYNTFGGSGTTPGYSVVTNSSAAGCTSLASDPIGASNQIKYSAAGHCATFGTSSSPVLWTASNSSPTTQNLQASWFADANNGWAVGARTTLLTQDSSGNWSPQTTCNTSAQTPSPCATDLNLLGVAGGTNGTAMAVGANSAILVTGDDGVDWTYYSASNFTTGGSQLWPSNATFQGVWTPDGVNFWAVGANGSGALAVQFVVSGGTISTAALEAAPSGSKNLSAVAGIANPNSTPTTYTLVAAGQGGYMMQSPDSGTTWAAETSGTTQQINGVALGLTSTNDLEGWAVANGGIVTGTTAGFELPSTWTAQTDATNQQLNAVWATPSGTAGVYNVWAAGNGGAIEYSASFGSWALETAPSTAVAVQGIDGFDSGAFDLHAVGQGGAIWDFNGFPNATGIPTNNGAPWVLQASHTNQQLNEVTGSAGSGLDMYAVGANDTVVYSTDDTTWNLATVSFGSKKQPLNGVASLPGSNTAWAVGGGGQVLTTANGSTWTTVSQTATNQPLNSVFALSSGGATYLWAVGNPQGNKETVIQSTDGGATWTSIGPTVSKAQPLQSVWAPDANHVWVVGGQGQIWLYDRSTSTWTQKTSNTNQQLNGISGVDANDIWVVGKHAGPNETILFWNGSAWSTPPGVATNNAQDLNDVHAYSDATGTKVFAVGQAGSSWVWDGSTWSKQAAIKGGGGASNFLGTTVIGTGIGQAWAVGGQGAIWNYNPYNPTGMSIASGGSIFSGGSPQLSSVVWDSDSGYVQGGQASCSSSPGITNLYYDTNYSCTSATEPTVQEALPTAAFPSTTGSLTCLPLANHSYGGSCKQSSNPAVLHNPGGSTCQNYVQFKPGIYNTTFKFAANTFYFFPSGIYYFDNIGNLQVNGNNTTYVVAGSPATATPAGVPSNLDPTDTATVAPLAAATPSLAGCWAYAQAQDTSSVKGAEFIFGGNTAMQIQNGSMEIFSRYGGNPSSDGTQGISVRESCSLGTSVLLAANKIACTWGGSGSGGGWDPSNIGGSDQILRFNGGGKPNVNIHGSIYAPDHNVELYSNTNTALARQIVGAVDAWTLEVASQNYTSPAVWVNAAGPLATRSIIITATAKGGSGSIPVKEESFVLIGPPGNDEVDSIISWRYCTTVTAATSGCTA